MDLQLKTKRGQNGDFDLGPEIGAKVQFPVAIVREGGVVGGVAKEEGGTVGLRAVEVGGGRGRGVA